MALPNAFIVGVQKAGTTTLHDWLSQHPEVYGPNEFKDVNFFIGSNDISDKLEAAFSSHCNCPILLQSYVNYMFYPEALENMASLCPSAKLIIILRDPIERCFSAYRYFKKMRREARSMSEALLYKPQYPLPYSRDNSDFTYIEHGLYSMQLEACLKYFDKNQILVLNFDELKNNPKGVLVKVYRFLGIRDNVFPELKPRNVTGEGTRFKSVQRLLLESNSLRKWIILNMIDFWLPAGKRMVIKQRLLELNTKYRPNKDIQVDVEEHSRIVSYLTGIYSSDISNLDKRLDSNYLREWKLDEKN